MLFLKRLLSQLLTGQEQYEQEPVVVQGKRRLIERGSQFHQSSGKTALKKKISLSHWRYLYMTDWFHSLVDAPTIRVLMILLTSYLLIVLFFAVGYYWISMHYGCHLEIRTFSESFVFSLETMATIGYGTSDIFFDDCLLQLWLLSIHVCVRLIVDATVIGIIYSR